MPYYNISESEKLGSGTHSDVHKCMCFEDKQYYAMKIYRDEYAKYFVNEIRLLNDLKSVHGILKVIDAVTVTSLLGHDTKRCLIFPLMHGSLFKLSNNQATGVRNPKKVVSIIKNVLKIMVDVHFNNILHGDIKPENILINKPVDLFANDDDIPEICIADFGSSCYIGQPFTRSLGTIAFMAPELLAEKEYNNKVDSWSVCLLLYELAFGCPLLGTDDSTTRASAYDSVTEDIDEYVGGGEEYEDDDIESIDTESADTCRSEYSLICDYSRIIGPVPDYIKLYAESIHGSAEFSDDIVDTKQEILKQIAADIAPDEQHKEYISDIADFVMCGLRYNPVERETLLKLSSHPIFSKYT